MSMKRDEQIKQAAIERGCIEGTAEYYGFIQGARYADQNPISPWISVDERLPDEDPNDKGYSVDVIGIFSDGHVSNCGCSIEEGIWFCEGLICDKPTHWMPIPEL